MSGQREVAFISDVTEANGEAIGLVVRSSGGLAGSTFNGVGRISCMIAPEAVAMVAPEAVAPDAVAISEALTFP
jgi:hypothetical protein